jgi:hypothetical protein
VSADVPLIEVVPIDTTHVSSVVQPFLRAFPAAVVTVDGEVQSADAKAWLLYITGPETYSIDGLSIGAA